MPMPSPPPAEDESGSGDHPSGLLAECQRLLEAVPAAAASSPAFRRHWPSISASLAALSASLASPAFPPAAPLLAPLAAALNSLLSVSDAGKDAHAPRLGHLHTVSLLSSTAAELAQLAADARLLAAPTPGLTSSSAAGGPGAAASGGPAAEDALVSRLRMGSAASRAAALEELASTAESLPAPSAAAAVNSVAALLDFATACCGDLRERAVAALAALSCSDAARPALAQEAGAVVPHLCRALESGSSASAAEHACAALLPLTSSSRDACAAVCARGGVAALLCACAGGRPAAQAAAAGVLRSLAAHADLLPAFRADEGESGGGGGAVPLLLQLVSLGTPRAQERALGCLQRLTAGDGDLAQRLKVEAFQAGALACVRDFLDGYESSSGESEPPGLAPALGLLRNMASFRYIAEIAAASGGGTFVAHVVAALGSDQSATRAEAALALAELCGNTGSGSKGAAGRHRQQHEALVADAAVPRLVWMLEAKSAPERDAAARALAAVLAASSACRKAFRRDERGVVDAVQLLADPSGSGARVETERRFPVSLLLAVAQSRRCRKQMVAAGACGFLQALVGAEVEGAKRLAECLGKGKMLGVFPRT